MDQDPRILASKEKVVQTAIAQMCEVGLPNVTIDGLSKKSGVAKTTIYRHWETLDDIILSAIDHMTGAPQFVDSGSLQQDVETTLMNLSRCFRSENWARCMPDIIEKGRIDKSFGEKKRQIMHQQFEPLTKAIQNARERGEIDANIDDDLLFSQLVGPLFMRYMLKNEPLKEELIKQHVATILSSYIDRS